MSLMSKESKETLTEGWHGACGSEVDPGTILGLGCTCSYIKSKEFRVSQTKRYDAMDSQDTHSVWGIQKCSF